MNRNPLSMWLVFIGCDFVEKMIAARLSSVLLCLSLVHSIIFEDCHNGDHANVRWNSVAAPVHYGNINISLRMVMDYVSCLITIGKVAPPVLSCHSHHSLVLLLSRR
jgi:hypothetical protein